MRTQPLPQVCQIISVSLLVVGFGCDPGYDVLVTPPPSGGVELAVKSGIGLIVDGKLNGTDANIFIDTGTLLTNLASPAAIAKFGLVQAGANPFAGAEEGGIGVCGEDGVVVIDRTLYVAERLELGAVVVENVAFTILREDDHDTFAEAGVDFILNAALMVQMDWRVDQGGRRLTLFPLNSRTRPESAVDLDVVGPTIPFAPFKIGAMTLQLVHGDGSTSSRETLIDTGGGVALGMGQEIFDTSGWDTASIRLVDKGLIAAGASCQSSLFRAPEVTLGAESYAGVITIILPNSGRLSLVGWPFFVNHASVYVSPGQAWIEFAKGVNTDNLFAKVLLTFGMEFAFNDGGFYEVVGAREGFSADREGVQVGDKVFQINGVDVNTLEGKALLFGEGPLLEGRATFLIEDAAGVQRSVELEAEILL